MRKIRLLVLSVGTQVGQNILTTLARRREALTLIATSMVAHEPAVFDYDAVYLVPPTAAEAAAFERRLLDIMEMERIDLVIPCRDDDVLFLAALRDRRLDLTPKLLCGTAEMARVICDKWLSAEFSLSRELPFAPSLAEGSAYERAEFVRAHGFPLVVKPRRGYASQDVYLVSTDAQLAHALDHGDWIAQEFLGDPANFVGYLEGVALRGVPLYHTFQGRKHSIQVLIEPDGSITHLVCTRNINQRRRSKFVEPDDDPASRELGLRCAEAFAAQGWRGPLNIQCQKNGRGELRIHKFNGRFTGATVDRYLLGHDEVGAAVERFTGRRIESSEPLPAAAKEVFESLVARAVDPQQVHNLERDSVWRRPR
jgi:biotin carboxylase